MCVCINFERGFIKIAFHTLSPLADRYHSAHEPRRRLKAFFTQLYKARAAVSMHAHTHTHTHTHTHARDARVFLARRVRLEGFDREKRVAFFIDGGGERVLKKTSLKGGSIVACEHVDASGTRC